MNQQDKEQLEQFRQALTLPSSRPPTEQAAGESLDDDDRYWQAARGELPADQTRQLLDQTKDDPVAAMAWQLAVEIDTEADKRRGFRPTHWWAVAALLAVALLAPLWLRQVTPPADPVWRSGGEAAIHSLAASAEPCPRARCRLTWSGPKSLKYRLVILAGDDTELLDRPDLEDSSFDLPADLLAPLPADSLLYWRVEATAPNGDLLQSETAVTRLD